MDSRSQAPLRPLARPDAEALVDWSELTLTRRCNQRCFFCYEEGRDIARDPDLAEIKRLLRATRRRADQVVLCGKEVVLRKDVLDIVAYAASLGLRVAVFSNGQAFARPGLVAELAEAGCHSVVVSFHFPDPETFALGARVHPKCFGRVLTGLGNIRAYMAAHPRRIINFATETDMFALNSGRLAGMRDTLRRALGETGWKMRLGSLLPTRVYDIGIPHVMEPWAERRAELAEFVRTQPAGLPLDFVKTPLCLLPPEVVHRSLDVQYVHEGTVLTFNHAQARKVTLDTISASAFRDVDRRLRSNPYRWVCRRCPLVAMCRCERTAWSCRFFEPTREQKPSPIPGLTAPAVLSRLGPARRPAARAEKVRRALQARPFPEERLLRALRGKPGLRVEEVWAEQAPVLAAALRFQGRLAAVRFCAPQRAPGAAELGAIIGCLHLRPAAGPRIPRKTWAGVLEAVSRMRLPDPKVWKDEPWFDRTVAAALGSAWDCFGAALWPGLGSLAGWRTSSVTLLPEARLRWELRRGQARARLTYVPPAAARPGGKRAAARLGAVLASGSKTTLSAYRDLLDAAGRLLGGPRSAPAPALDVLRAEAELWFRDFGWHAGQRQSLAAPSGTPGTPGPDPSCAGGLRFAVRCRDEESVRYEFRISAYQAGRSFYRRSGQLMLWYTHELMDEPGQQFGEALLRVMKALGSVADSDAGRARWRRAVALVLERVGLTSRFDWDMGPA